MDEELKMQNIPPFKVKDNYLVPTLPRAFYSPDPSQLLTGEDLRSDKLQCWTGKYVFIKLKKEPILKQGVLKEDKNGVGLHETAKMLILNLRFQWNEIEWISLTQVRKPPLRQTWKRAVQEPNNFWR